MVRYRFLLHSSDASYDDEEKEWSFELDQRIDRPVSIRVAKAHFANATSEVQPLVVYLRSRALANMILKKHTVRLQNTQHRRTNDIICSLGESHAVGRYTLENDDRRFRVDPSRHVKQIDIRFSNNDTLLGAQAAAGASSGTDDEIEAIPGLLCWTDFDNSRMFNVQMVESTGPGSEVNYIYDRHNSALLWQLEYGNSLSVVNIGDHGAQGVYRNGSWHSVVDTTPLGSIPMENEYTVHMVWQLNSINDHAMLMYFSSMKVCMWQGSLSYFKLATNHVAHVVPGITIIPTKPYLMTIQRRSNAQDYEFHWTLERLDTNEIQESVTEPSSTGALQANPVWRIGYAATAFDQFWGPTIIHNGLDAGHISSCQTWLRNKINGTATAEEGTVSANAEWYVELDITTQE